MECGEQTHWWPVAACAEDVPLPTRENQAAEIAGLPETAGALRAKLRDMPSSLFASAQAGNACGEKVDWSKRMRGTHHQRCLR